MKNKITFVVSFGDNSKYVYDEIVNQQLDIEVSVLYKGKSDRYFQDDEGIKLIPFESTNIIHTLLSIYHLATSKKIIIDNYFGFLAVTDFKNEVEVIQLWHASGAIKKFGLEDQSVQYRSARAQQRFLKVYEKFDKVIVGSDVMANTFMSAFNLSSERILRTGIPRTDFFYDEDMKKNIVTRFSAENHNLQNKKKILYAPTYRDNELNNFQLTLELDQMQVQLGDDYIVLLRLHPAVQTSINFAEKYPGFVYDYSGSQYDINDLLLFADLLVTDYSSIPFEFSLMNKPMIFFAYDLEAYQRERGLMSHYEKMVPGPVVGSTNELINIIQTEKYDYKLIQEYASKWNKYSTGHSSRRLVQYMFEHSDVAEESKRRAL
ncbi:CDP-glycerol glycerophosphotransferase family protein [Cytobacillus horneckiae]|uniref:CDP-glycerol glycerophosphotransferase family protein n=1 Tax=Cytobacillus horneckiae TaxID=549687 RepID=UPI001F150028|nr:CDP-glycerol glycerophosphotransferase family protein [Cytobacillus horneckiae]